MNESAKTTRRYAMGGCAVLCLLVLFAWVVLRERPSPAGQQPVVVESARSPAPDMAPEVERAAAPIHEETAPQEPASVVTNAADLYRQAFALFTAFTNDPAAMLILSDWQTNVDAATEADLCEKMRPICDLMHQASAVTNCDWGVEPIMWDTKLPYLNASRQLARAVVWNAAHCRPNDATGAAGRADSRPARARACAPSRPERARP